MRSLLALLLLCCALSTSAQTVMFAGNVAKADIPAGYEHYFEERRKTLVLVPSGFKDAEIRITFNSLREYLAQKPDVGREFVKHAASKRGKQLFDVPSNGGVAFIDFTQTSVHGARKVEDTHGMMGLRDGYATFTVSIAQEKASSEPAKALLSGGIRTLLASIRSAA